MQKVGEIVAESVFDYDDPFTKKWKEKNQNFESWYAQNKRVQHSKTRLEKFNAGHYNVMKCRLPIFIVYLLSYYLRNRFGMLKSIYNMHVGKWKFT